MPPGAIIHTALQSTAFTVLPTVQATAVKASCVVCFLSYIPHVTASTERRFWQYSVSFKFLWHLTRLSDCDLFHNSEGQCNCADVGQP